MARSQQPNRPVIKVPRPSEDHPRFGRVGLIAVVGFAIGVAWPSVARVNLVAPPPNDDAKPASPVAALTDRPASSASPASPAQPPSVLPTPPSSADRKGGAKVGEGQILSCVDADGKKYRRCDKPELAGVVGRALESLVACPGATTMSGRVSVGFDLDFDTGKTSHFVAGRSTTLRTADAQSLVDCAEQTLAKVSLADIKHGFSQYRIFYLVELDASGALTDREPPRTEDPTAAVSSAAVPAPSSAPSPAGQIVGTSGKAVVVWETAIVRESPKTGSIVARILGGTRLIVTARQGDWYRIKYDAKGSEGWVYREAIGL